jgi:hypothetical protein
VDQVYREETMSVNGPYYWLLDLELALLQRCQPYDVSWLSALLAIGHYAPQLITVWLFGVGVWRRQLYLVLFGFGLLFDDLVCRVGNAVLPSDASVRVSPGCLPVYGDALSYQVQQTTFFVTFGLGYAVLYRARANLHHIGLAVWLHAAVAIGMHQLNQSTREAVLAGAAVGALDALVYQTLLHWLIVPHFAYILATAPRWLDCRDTLCGAEHYSQIYLVHKFTG